MPTDDDLMDIDVGDESAEGTSEDGEVEEARQAMVECQGDRLFSDIPMNDPFWERLSKKK